MADKKPATRLTKDGLVQVMVVQPPGCLARVEAWLKAAAWAGVWFAAGVVVGLWLGM